nr:putative reverse transcriptase domain-containing protein [Tanacetum cinerariifolium]
ALGTRLDMSTNYHPQTDGQSERTIQTLEDMHMACFINFGGSWDVHLPLVEFSYNNYHSNVRCASFEALYGRKCRPPILWAEIIEGRLIGPKINVETVSRFTRDAVTTTPVTGSRDDSSLRKASFQNNAQRKKTSPSNSSELHSPTPHQEEEENDPVNNYMLDLIIYIDQLPAIKGGESLEFKQTKGMFKCFGHFLSNLGKK